MKNSRYYIPANKQGYGGVEEEAEMKSKGGASKSEARVKSGGEDTAGQRSQTSGVDYRRGDPVY